MSSSMFNFSNSLTLGDGLLASALTKGWWHEQWMNRPAASALASTSDWMFMWLWWFCVVWFVFLMALMGWFVWAHRRRVGAIAPRSPSHHTVLELVWTIVPTLFLAWMFFKGFHGYMDRVVAPGNAMEMNLTAWKWNWKIEYPNGYESTAQSTIGARPIPVFYLPEGTPIRFRMNSLDVMHAFWIPDLRMKQDVVPNRYTTMWIEFDKNRPGHDVHEYPASKEVAETSDKWAEFRGSNFNPALAGVKYTQHYVFCAEYCGTEHSEMAALIRVIPADTFPAYLQSIGIDQLPLVEIGKVVYKTKCASCHSVDGGANTGPTWQNMYGYEHSYTDGKTILADDNHIRESIREPGKHVRAGGFANQMTPWPANLLPEKHLSGVIEYMKTLSDKGGAGGGSPAGDGAAPAGEHK